MQNASSTGLWLRSYAVQSNEGTLLNPRGILAQKKAAEAASVLATA